MIVDINPRRLEVRAGFSHQVTVTITNTTDLIGGYSVRILGADPSWVDAPAEPFSLFPDEALDVPISIEIPGGIPAGERQISVQVRELTAPYDNSIDSVILVVPAAPALQVRADPIAIHAGRTGRFAILLDNTGNTTTQGALAATDAEAATTVVFTPANIELAPGEHAVVDMKVKARRPWMGSPLVRMLDIYFDDPNLPERRRAELPDVPAPRRGIRRQRDLEPVVVERDVPPLANATFIQRPIIGRGSISLLGLVAAMTIFAVVITLALSRIVGQSAADRNLALEIASAQSAAGQGSGASSVSGMVRLLTSGNGVASIAVDVYAASDTATPLATTSTGADGTYSVGQLPAGEYKLTFRGAGFSQLWYPQALDAADAEVITLDPNTKQSNINVALGGVPATLGGTVKGDDVSGSTLTLRTTDANGAAIAPGVPLSPAITPASFQPASFEPGAFTRASFAPATNLMPRVEPNLAPPAGAVVKTVTIGSDGTFEISGVPSPSVYEISLSKDGYATSSQLIDVAAGEARSGLNLTLLKGDGVISGKVTANGEPVSNATIEATSGQIRIATASLDESGDKAGNFTLRGLPTPGNFTITVTKANLVTQTLAVQLSSGQTMRDLDVNLDRSTGKLSGEVKIAGGGPAGGVAVTVTNGIDTVQTSTRSAGKIGSWDVDGLDVPGTYTVTATRPGLAPRTVSVALDSRGTITAESQGNGVTAGGISMTMRSSTASLIGTVRQIQANGNTPLGEASLTLTSGTSTFTVYSASRPASARGQFQFIGIPPGTYSVSVSSPGVRPVSTTLTLGAGSQARYNPLLQQAASISGTVYQGPCVGPNTTCPAVGAGWEVELFRATSYPGERYQVTTTASDGSFTFVGLDAPESYIIQASPSASRPPEGTVPVVLSGSEQLTNVRLVVSP